jgi:hypothetical protein
MKILLYSIIFLLAISLLAPSFAFLQTAGKVEPQMQLGETFEFTWGLDSEFDESVSIKLAVYGEGKELVVLPSSEIQLEPGKFTFFDIKIVIPTDYSNDLRLKPYVLATLEGEKPEGGGTAINIAMKKKLDITIGNPPLEEVTSVPIIIPDPIHEPTPEPTVDVEPKQSGSFVIKPQETTQVPIEPMQDPEPTVECRAGTEVVNGICKVIQTDDGGGCLIATAAFGSELAPQVQYLREIRDNTVLSTASGTAFMSGFNTLYYSFAPTIADMERENPMFQEAVRVFITPMISTLSIMSLADNGSEVEVLGLGVSIIMLNIGMYMAAPVLVIRKIHNIRK